MGQALRSIGSTDQLSKKFMANNTTTTDLDEILS